MLFPPYIPDNNSYWNGKQLPRDKKSIQIQPVDPTQHWDGYTLPDDKVTPQVFSDPFNKPGLIILNNGTQQIALPPDTVIVPKVKKTLVQTHILDGVSVFEHIMRDPVMMEFQGVFRMQDINGTRYNNTNPPAGLVGTINNVFAQDYMNDVWNFLFIPNTILILKNSFLNGIGIQQIIVEEFAPLTVSGSKNIPYKLTAWENVPGQSIIIG